MKKVLLSTVLAFLGFCSLKAQGTMIVHGTTATMFYLYENHQIYHIMADELWFTPGPVTDNVPGGKIVFHNPVFNPVPNYTPVGDPIEIYMSCYEAKQTFGGGAKGQCGALRVTSITTADGVRVVQYECMNNNNNACLIISLAGNPRYSHDGHY